MADWAKRQAVVRRLRPDPAEPGFHAGWIHFFRDGDLETAQAGFKDARKTGPAHRLPPRFSPARLYP
jgi:hypothetical protein